jgi:hypothetical protein
VLQQRGDNRRVVERGVGLIDSTPFIIIYTRLLNSKKGYKMTVNEIYKKNMDRVGCEYMLNKLIQECGELIVAACHYKEGRFEDPSKIFEEGSHVQIALEHLMSVNPEYTNIFTSGREAKIEQIRDVLETTRDTQLHLELIALDEASKIPQVNAAHCSECEWKGPLSECETEMVQECWEHPQYRIHVCPKCGAITTITLQLNKEE